jgi:hypothetical protein
MPYGGVDHALGERPSNRVPGLISPREDERRLVSLVAAVDLMPGRCEEAMPHTSRPSGTEALSPRPAIRSHSLL